VRLASCVHRVVASLVVSTGLLAAPAATAQNCTPFTDVLASDPFCANIQWMFNRGITLGCAANQYCPAQFVRRDQMAAFMNRLGDLVQNRVTGSCAVGNYIRAIAADGTVTCGTDASGPASAFVQNGNAFGVPAVLGSNDAQPLELRAAGARVVRYEPNAVSPNIVGGHAANGAIAGVRGATIAGGGVPAGSTDPDYNLEAPNRVTGHYGAIGGGYANVAGADDGNPASGPFATVAGGLNNRAGASATTVGGGSNNAVSGSWGVIGGGSFNGVEEMFATVAGGSGNQASGGGSAIGGGFDNVASAEGSVVPGGAGNSASGVRSLASGSQSEARGDYSIAMGRRAKTFAGANPGVGAIVFADSNNFDFAESFDNRLAIRATGGMRVVTAIDAGGAPTRTMTLFSSGNLDVEGTVTSLSDRAAKTAIEPVDTGDVLARLLAVPIAHWSYTAAPEVRHIGPMAQDFHAAFRVGAGDRSIANLDGDGVALAAIQGLNAKLEQQAATQAERIVALENRLARLEALWQGTRAVGPAITGR